MEEPVVRKRPRDDSTLLLPVTLAETNVPAEPSAPAMPQSAAREPCCKLELSYGILRIRGELTPELLRMLIGEMKAGAQWGQRSGLKGAEYTE